MPINTLADIRNKVRRITARPSAAQITDAQIDEYINTFYIYDLSEHLHLQNLRYNYQFITNANQPVYDFPKEFYLTNMPPVYIGGYQSYMTQSRENFFRINPKLMFMQQSAATGNGTAGPYNIQLTSTPVVPGFKPNPPGAYVSSAVTDIAAKDINWNVRVSAIGPNGVTVSLTDDGGSTDPTGLGLLFDPTDVSTNSTTVLSPGWINYQTGQIVINFFSYLGAVTAIPIGNPINVQYTPYVASRPQSVCFFQDQFILYPVPDQAYQVSFEAYKYPTELLNAGDSPQLNEWWQLLAYGAADKIFADNADFENMAKFRPLLDEQMRLVMRRTIVQQTSERTSTIFTEQSNFQQFPFGNLF